MEEIKKAKLKDLIQDDRNLNKGTERGQQLIEKSLRELGAGRSLLLDKNNRIIAGNKTHKNAEALGRWDGGTEVDAGATNRKLGSDMGDAVTGGGLHGKDLSKADVSVNIYLFTQAQLTGKKYEAYCRIGSDVVIVHKEGDFLPMPVRYAKIVEEARQYVDACGGFEKLAEWGLI